MMNKIIDKIKGWWNRMFDYNKIAKDFDLDIDTSRDILDAFQKFSNIYNGHEPWIDDNTKSLHVAKTACEKVAKAVTIEYKSLCSEPYINKIYQKFLRNKRRNTEYMVGKSCIFFKPYYSNGNIKISVIQADKFIPVKFDDDGNLLGLITIDQITKGNDVYTRLEYQEIKDNKAIIKNICYVGRKDSVILQKRIELSEVDKWKDIEPVVNIEGVDRIIGGFASMKNTNTIDNSFPCGVPLWYGAIETLEEIDKQFSRTLWEYEGTELAIDADVSLLASVDNGNAKMPERKERLFRKLNFDETKDKTYNIFSPEIRDSSLFNGLNEYLRQSESQMNIAFGTLSKLNDIAKTATEIKSSKQEYYVTVSDIQDAMQQAFDDLIYGIYVLCKLYGIPVKNDYSVEHDWDDSILVDKESARNQALIERNNDITSDVQYVMDTKNMKEKEAIEYVKRQQKYRKLTKVEEDKDPEEE